MRSETALAWGGGRPALGRTLEVPAPGVYCAAMKSLLFAGALAVVMAPVVAAAPAKETFVCTEILGVSVTGDWYGGGFETGVDERRFQAITRKHAFIELWGDPKNEIWAVPVTSPCAQRSRNPDRVVFTGVNWQMKDADSWTAAFTKAVEAIKLKRPGVARIELMTMLRAPGNQSCGDYRTVVEPYIDEAIARVVARYPTLVQAAPRFEAPTCAVFTKGGPHYTNAGIADVAKVYAAHYGHPHPTASRKGKP
jgi:hypothetical protein